LERISKSYGLQLSRDDLESFRKLMDGVLASYRRLDQFAEPTLPVKYPRDVGYRPAVSENRLNAWYWRCSIKGAPSGHLAGKKIAIKDNVCVAGIPMMNGSNVLEGYAPDVDATIVTRILDAVGRSLVSRSVSIFASRGAATPPIQDPCLILMTRNDPLGAPPAAARPWWSPKSATWRLAAIREVQSEFPVRTAGRDSVRKYTQTS
jgi:Amidase